MVRIACMTLPYVKFPFERALEGISRAGYKHLAFGHAHMGTDYPNENDAGSIAALQELFAKYDLEPVLLVSNLQFKLDQPIERALQRLRTAKELGIKELLTIGTQSYRSFPKDPLSADEMKPLNEAFVERFKRVAEEAEALDLTVMIKPHTGNTATAAHIMETLQQIGSPHILGCYDPGNVHFYEGLSAAADFPQMVERTHAIVAKDHRGSQAELDFPVPGTGDVDFPAIFATLQRSGFAGSVIVERVDGPADPDLIDERLAAARVQVERLLQAAGFTVA